MNLYPLSFEPHYVPKLWGGQALRERLGRHLPPGEAIGESWEIYDRGDLSSVVAEGPLKGRTLGELVRETGPRLLGDEVYQRHGDRFPLLVKLIDANDWLSVQVHPDDDYAALHVDPDEPGKTEVWHLVHAAEGAQMIAGLNKGTDRAAFQVALKEGRLEKTLNRFSVATGDSIFIPAGRVHAIGPGCLVAEIQQNSDTTYRLFDFDRKENGKPRELHLSQALETIRFDESLQGMPNVQEPKPGVEGSSVLASCDYFTFSRIQTESRFRDPQAGSCFHVLMPLKAMGTLVAAGSEPQALVAGRSLLIPATVDWHLDGPCDLLWARP